MYKTNDELQASSRNLNCPICASERKCSIRFHKKKFFIYSCSCCDTLFVHPQPSLSEVLSIYDASYFMRGKKYSSSNADNQIEPNKDNDQQKLAVIKRHQQRGHLLDIGCALGGFLVVAKEEGYDISGLEVSSYAADCARKSTCVDIKNCSLAEAKFPSEFFDVITMWDVLEHLDSPAQAFQEVHRLLKQHGVFSFSTGDTGSFWARLTGRYWQLLTPPQHLFYFNKKSLEKFLTKYDFSVEKVTYLGKKITVNFLLFKARETFGSIVAPLQFISRVLGLNNVKIYINLHDIVTIIARKN